ncbi:nucleoside recognition domain-containing protein [Cytophaga aurantiaca]|uniref:nucleoside recognition domain-containing protein n=1 Tax=Cytophaga aurantiaca TaxID=29530 RepID=UPI000378D620|nr:nucleoside recognition domain-containing protein [Cytophaga aurantiaca]
MLNEFKSLLKDTTKSAVGLYKIMIPISIAVKLLQYLGWINMLGDALAPIMKLIGLPGACGIIWATTMVTNIYGGMMAFYSLAISDSLTTAQVSILCSMMLMAHALPIELQIARKAGCRLWVMFLIRFGFGIVAAFVMNQLLLATHFLQEPNIIQWKPEVLADPTLLDWFLGEIKKYIIVFFVVMALLFVMRVLKKSGALDKFSAALKPVLGIMGINKDVIPMTVIGLSLGILYGGALIIKETEEKNIPKMDVFYAFVLMGLCHSLIEDSLLMISMGADWSMIFIFRMLFALLVTFILVKIAKRIPEKWIEKIVTRKA